MVYKLSMSQDIKLHIFQQIRTSSCNWLSSSYFRSVTGYDKQTSFKALNGTILNFHINVLQT